MKAKRLFTFSVVAFMLLFTVAPAFAFDNHNNNKHFDSGDDDVVENYNEAEVINDVTTIANTGGNFADGSYAGSGGDGGDIRLGDRDRDNHGGPFPGPVAVQSFDNHYDGDDSENKVEESTTGDGGAGGNAGTGGTVITGNANAYSNLTNDINSNDTEVDRCACDEDGEPLSEDSIEDLAEDAPEYFLHNDDVTVRSRNRAMLANSLYTKANTGKNDALGSYAGEGGSGGDIALGDGDENEVDESNTGMGGIGGDSGEGGLVQSGEAYSETTVVNTVNRNLTRIRR